MGAATNIQTPSLHFTSTERHKKKNGPVAVSIIQKTMVDLSVVDFFKLGDRIFFMELSNEIDTNISHREGSKQLILILSWFIRCIV